MVIFMQWLKRSRFNLRFFFSEILKATQNCTVQHQFHAVVKKEQFLVVIFQTSLQT